MIMTTSEANPYQTRFSNEVHASYADTTADKGGGGSGFRPHELLEAALATRMNIHLRMYVNNHGIALESVSTAVSVDRSNPVEAIFKYSIVLPGNIDPEARGKLMTIAESCPVRLTLSRKISFLGT